MKRHFMPTDTELPAKSVGWEEVTVGEVVEAIDLFIRTADPDRAEDRSEIRKALTAWATVIANARKEAE